MSLQRCSFCGKDQSQVAKLIAGPGHVTICDECVALCQTILADELTTSAGTDRTASDTAGQPGGPPEPRAVVWAGWRGEYVAAADESEKSDAARGVAVDAEERCVFCRIVGLRDDNNNTDNIVWCGDAVFAILNAYPYTSGHLMVMPYRHVGELEDLTAPESAELWTAVQSASLALKGAYRPEGINVGVNLGRAAGAGIPGHLHIHLVPRWNGDTNFMTATANTRVLPETLERSGAKLAAAWPSSSAPATTP